MPLTVVVRDGRAAGKGFSGTMRARAFGLGRTQPAVQVGLVSTAASRMSSKERGYSRSVKKVRRTLGIGAGSLPDSLRYRNSDVGYRQLKRRIHRTKGGFDALAAKIARKAEKGARIKGLKPTSAMASGPRRRANQASAAGTAPDTTVCSAPVPTRCHLMHIRWRPYRGVTPRPKVGCWHQESRGSRAWVQAWVQNREISQVRANLSDSSRPEKALWNKGSLDGGRRET